MLANDLSAEVMPTMVVIFDDLLGTRHERARRLRKPAQHWALHPETEAVCNDAMWRVDANLEVVTFTADEQEVTELLLAAFFPATCVRALSSEDLARETGWRQDMRAVYHPYPDHLLRYGPCGRLITKQTLGLIGKI